MVNRCPKCGYANPLQVNVCGQCASPLVRHCTNCGFENPVNFKFCGNCGSSFTAATTRPFSDEARPDVPRAMPAALAEKISSVGKQIEGERRTVTVLFADLSGFTAIAEKLDPEQVFELIDSTRRVFIDEIYEHEGWLDKLMGDGVMALFGAPVTHEDDPARAVRAALGMRNALRRLSEDLEARLGIALKVRIGLNSGLVVVGRLGSDWKMEYTALGDTVNVAARLQSVAEPGTILASRSVFEHTQALFEFRELGAIRVKNRVEPVEIFEAIAARHKAGRVRGIPGLSAPMVGREDEFARLRQCVDKLTSDRQGHIGLVTGDAGIGKSRLMAELKAYLANKQVTVLEGACLSYSQPAYGVFLRLLKSFLDIADNDPEEIVREKIERGVQGALPSGKAAAETLPYIEQLFSIRIFEKEMATRIRHLTPPQLQQQTFLAIRDLLVARAQAKPLVLILEDIHWIDPPSLDLLTFLLGTVEHAPLLIYCNSRPDEGLAAAQIQRLGNELYPANFLHLALAPLSQADSVALVDLLLTIPELPESLKQMVPQRAEGNPFYLEEIIRMLIDRGIIRRNAGRWEVASGADLENLQVPTTLQGLIMTRVDSLTEGSRQVAQCAAVIGRDFSNRLLATVVEDTRDLQEDIQELEERQLVSRIGGDGDATYRFAHILIQETIYHSLLVRRREYLHHKIADGVEALGRDRLDEHVEELAFHYTESKDLERALPYLIRAGQRAEERFANEQALRHYQLAATLLIKTSASLEQHIQVYTGLASVQSFVGEYDSAINTYRIALECIRTAGKAQPPREGAEIMRRIGRVYERRGDYGEALRWLEDGLSELDRDAEHDLSEERARIFNDIGWVQYRRGQFEEAYQWRMRSLQLTEGTEHYNEAASAYAGLVALFTRKGDWTRALAYAEKALRLRETIGDTFGVSQSHTNLGAIAGEQCDWDLALHHFEQSLAIKQKIGDVRGTARLQINVGVIYREKGEYARATYLLSKALQTAEKIKHADSICLALNNQANVQVLLGQFDAAIACASRSLDIAIEMGSKEVQAEAQWLLAEARLGRKQFDLALQSVEPAAAIAAEIGSRLLEGQALRALGKIAVEQGDLQTAHNHLQRSITILTELKNPFELAKSQYQLALLQREQGQWSDARASLEQAHDTFVRLGAEAERQRARVELERLAVRAPATKPQ